jgi:hypothetical protein
MESHYGPPWTSWYGGPYRSGYSDPNMRVSDTERSEMSDALSKHYADGRLDDTEFKVRLDKAMGAKTRGDLNGLLSDLPPLQTHSAPRRAPGMVRRAWWSFSMLSVVVFAIVMTAVFTPHIPWLLLFVVLFFVWRRSGRISHHHYRDHHRVGY